MIKIVAKTVFMPQSFLHTGCVNWVKVAFKKSFQKTDKLMQSAYFFITVDIPSTALWTTLFPKI